MQTDTRPLASEAKKLREAIEGAREVDMMAVSGGQNNGRAWLGALIAILQALGIAGILALFGSISALKDSNARLETKIDERGKQYDRDIQRIDTALDRHDKRLADLERSQGSGELNSHDRQKR